MEYINDNYSIKNIYKIVLDLSLARNIYITEKQSILDLTYNSNISNPSKQPVIPESTVHQITKSSSRLP